MKRQRRRCGAPVPFSSLPFEVLCAIRDALAAEAADRRALAQTCWSWQRVCAPAMTATVAAYDAQCRRASERVIARLIPVAHLWCGHWIDLNVADALALQLGTCSGGSDVIVRSRRDDDLRSVRAALLLHRGSSIESPYRVYISDGEWRFERLAAGAPKAYPIIAAALLELVVERAPSAQRMPLLRALLRKLACLATWRIVAGKTLESYE